MPVISKIVLQKHNKERYSIFTDSGAGEVYAFSVDEDVLIKYQLKKGMELDESAVADMLFQDDIRKAYNAAVHYLSHRMRSEGEVREYLQKKEISEPVIQEAVDKLYQFNFLNDEEFALAFVRTQMNTTDKGPEVVKMDLKQKGLSGTIIERALKEYPLDVQVEKAVQLGRKYAAKNQKDSSRILKQKLEQLLIRKGYPFQVISIAMEDVTVEKQEEFEMDALIYQGEKLCRKHSKLSGAEFTQKIKQGLYQKGFPMDMIERFMEDLDG
ncbi:recombinase RecX [Mesobacillus campisalis]|uniref:Regulatory protein RecX n=1 Tax=Mesobacillus campisalis TaxID=1408103 RepID=A0A0M2SQP5_9BACI|nr:recombination regulator RecX [Mesobacillus campisalis]KKK36548.1 recombinase RecX [Mesobacillus campisalis]